MAKTIGAIKVDIGNCKGCGLCVVACPFKVLNLAKQVNHQGYHYSYMAYPDNCIGCANCALVCPDTVITVYRKKTEDIITT